MTRREWMQLVGIAAASARPAHAENYGRCLPEYLARVAKPLYEARKDWQAKLYFINMVQREQRYTRDNFWKVIGGKFEPTPLHLKTTGVLDRPGFRIEKLTYESQPGLLVTANLYVPTAGKPPYPGVLFQMGHGEPGKAYETYQKCCRGLARLGFVVLAFDPMGQGERRYYADLKLSPTDEHTQIGRQLLLAGDTCTRWQLWDSVRSLDVLAAHPLVDKTRLASTGQSGGGTTTMFLAAVDERLTAAVVCMGNTENFVTAEFSPPGSTDDAEQDLLPKDGVRLDRWDLLLPFAPRPLLVIASSRDAGGTYSPEYLRNGREEFASLRQIYGVTGREADLAWAETPLPHGLGFYARQLIYDWFQRHLGMAKRPVSEAEPAGSGAVEPARELWAAGGDAVKAGSRTPLEILRERSATIRPVAGASVDVRRWLKVEELPREAKAVSLAKIPADFGSIEALEITSVEPVRLPVFAFAPSRAERARTAWLVLDEKGRKPQAAENSLCSELARSGVWTYAADVRGIGEMTAELPRFPAGYGSEHVDEESYAWASLLLDRPLAGQRVTDILAIVRALLARPELQGAQPLGITASGRMTGPALWAAVLEPRVTAVTLYGGLGALRQLVETRVYRHEFSVFVPDALRRMDFPAAAAAVGPRPVRLVRTVDGAGAVMPEADVSALYGRLSHVRVLSDTAWQSALA